MNIWRGTNPDHNANKTTADVVLALKQFKQITQQPQNAATSRARYDFLPVSFFLSLYLEWNPNVAKCQGTT